MLGSPSPSLSLLESSALAVEVAAAPHMAILGLCRVLVQEENILSEMPLPKPQDRRMLLCIEKGNLQM